MASVVSFGVSFCGVFDVHVVFCCVFLFICFCFVLCLENDNSDTPHSKQKNYRDQAKQLGYNQSSISCPSPNLSVDIVRS